MILGRPTLRPVVWSDVDRNGKFMRSEPSLSSDDAPQYSSSKKMKRPAYTPMYIPPPLSPSEKVWSKRCEFLFHKGYQLRPRYQSHWNASLRRSGTHTITAEDHIMQILPRVLDAIRRQDGLVVCLKLIQDPPKVPRIRILDYFTSRRMTSDTRNHVVPLFDTFSDAYDTNLKFLVMPVLRRFDDPEFVAPSEVVDFISQALEGLAFLHGNSVAHHNLNADHIMMDAKAIIPTGWHFVSHFCEPDGVTRISPLERRNFPVRYCFVGFGKAYHIPPSQPRLVADIGGEDAEAPELQTPHPYDPFKLDIYTLGNVFKKELFDKYNDLDFISDILLQMHMPDFTQRPTAERVLQDWYKIRQELDEESMENMRLHPKGTPRRHSHRHQPSPSGSIQSTNSGSARSNKRDISSILNEH